MSGTPATRTQHIDALVLAFANSRAKSLVGTDALRTVVAGQYRDMVRDGKFHLQAVWSLLEGQPGFAPENVRPPLCRFKTWEDDLDLEVVLPDSFGELSSLEIRALADECMVSSKELDRVLARGSFTDNERAARAAKWSEDTGPAEVEELGGASRHHNWVLGALAALALGAFGVAGYALYDTVIAPAETSSVAPSLFTNIPVRKATRAGFDIKVTELSDEGWFTLPISEREDAMRRSLREFARDGIRGLFVFDRSGKTRATAQTFGAEKTQIRVRFSD